MKTLQRNCHFVYDNTFKAPWFVHKELKKFATKSKKPLKDFHLYFDFA
jgi:hypothetical protein